MRLAPILAALAAVFALPAAAAPVSPQAARAFEDAQMASASRAGAALARAAARLAARDPPLKALVADREEAEGRWRAVDERRIKSLGEPGETAQAEARALAELQVRLRDQVSRDDAALAARFPDYVEITSPAPLALARAQALLGPREALVVVLPTPEATYIWAVRKGGAQWFRAAIGEADIARVVARLRGALDPAGTVRAGVDASGGVDSAPEVRAFPRADAYGLYQQIWAPAEPMLKDADLVYVVAGGALGSLPFAVLPTAAPEGADTDPEALRRTPWLFRRHALATLPAVSSLRLFRARAGAGGHASPFAGFGDPSLESGTGAAALKGLTPLPGARTELLALARTLDAPASSVVTGMAATEAAVRSAPLERARVVAFATHGLLAGETGALDEPALALTPSGADDGLLTASEAAQLRLTSADWVVLSACNTAAGDGHGGLAYGGEGLSGLARGFFYAGARALLVSHWRVRDDAAARLTSETIRAYANDRRAGRAAALQKAMARVLEDRSDPTLAQPSAWAPFVVAGDGA